METYVITYLQQSDIFVDETLVRVLKLRAMIYFNNCNVSIFDRSYLLAMRSVIMLQTVSQLSC